jgi:predicted RNase H-like HicB family nuclease
MEEGEGFLGSIPSRQGVWAQGTSLEFCRVELQSTLEDWLLFSLGRGLPIPVLAGVDLSVKEVA